MTTKKELFKKNLDLQVENFRLKFDSHIANVEKEKSEKKLKELEKELEELKKENSAPSLWPLVLIMLLFSSINKDKEEKENGES